MAQTPLFFPPEERATDMSLAAFDPLEWLRGLFQSSPSDTTQTDAAIVQSVEGQAFVLREGQRSPLHEGDDVLVGDALLTAVASAVSLRFADGMLFRIGGDARLSIDDFFFDQQDSSGIQTLSMIKGAFSFQSGALAQADSSQVHLKTALGTLGIRGTKLLGITDTPLGECIITLLEGRVHVIGDRGGEVWLTRPLETASMKIDWDYVGFDAYSPERATEAYADLLFNGDRQRTIDFIEQNKGAFAPPLSDPLFEISHQSLPLAPHTPTPEPLTILELDSDPSALAYSLYPSSYPSLIESNPLLTQGEGAN